MVQWLLTDFVKNPWVQKMTLIGMIADFALSQSIRHVLVLFSLPYLTSVALGYWLPIKKKKVKGRISEQYRVKK